MKGKILVIEDEPTMRLGMNHFLSSSGYQVEDCQDGEEGLAAIKNRSFDLVISDLRLPKLDGLSLLNHINRITPETGVIIITAYAEIKTAVQAIKDGAFDYLAKPFSNEELLITIERFIKFRRMESELNELRRSAKEAKGFDKLIGMSRCMKDVFDRIVAIANTDVSVLIQGESGTGKELVADAIHNLSKRKDQPYIKINCAAIPENLFESELFGYEKGAFTGALETRKGKYELANGGTLFFDEISEMPLNLQTKLFRVIEDQTITRLGGAQGVKVDVRGIYATSRNLKEFMKMDKFREELYYRINVVPIEIPSLRERREDIPCLIEYFLKYFNEKYKKTEPDITPSAYEALLNYDYPGNVRELKNAIERAVLLSRDGKIDVKHLPSEIYAHKIENSISFQGDIPFKVGIRSLEKQMILEALNETKGKKIEAARRLGISRKVFWKKMKEYKIDKFPKRDIK
jgi:DNA-binding NtrC family response regulator